MRKITVLFILLGLVWFPACKPKKQARPYKPRPEEISTDILVPGNYTPVTAVWVKKDVNNDWIAYKCFNSVNELREIENYIQDPEKLEHHPGFTGGFYLVVYYVPPRQPVWVRFSLDDLDKEVYAANGRSKVLYKLFTEKKEWEDYRTDRSIKFPSEFPVNAVWVKKITEQGRLVSVKKGEEGAWTQNLVPYKCFNSVEELREIIWHFDEPENKEISSFFVGNEIMLLWYIPPTDPIWLSFSIDDSTKEVVTQKGRSKKLYNLLTEKEKRPYKSFSDRPRTKAEEQLSTDDANLTDRIEQVKKQ